MSIAFIIMQIGNSELDSVCEHAIVPAISDCSLDPRRVDKHNEGGLLKSEIIGFIEQAEIIVADLTNERPNCYLEIGYAMGMAKLRNLILTARHDHDVEHPAHTKGGPKVHFDLSGYDILFWDPDDLDGFRAELAKRIQRRLAIVTEASPTRQDPWDHEWIATHRQKAIQGIDETDKKGFMEIRFALDPPKPVKRQQELDAAAREAQIETFGWPIAVYLHNRTDFRPRPTADGIVAEVKLEESYDYWAIRRSCDFYLLKTIFEDVRRPGALFFNTRIVRVTETLLYCARLYTRLDIDPSTTVSIVIRHGGLRGRMLESSNPDRRLMGLPKTTMEDEVETDVRMTIGDIERDLVGIVKRFVEPLFILFDFREFAEAVYEDIVNKFVAGEAS